MRFDRILRGGLVGTSGRDAGSTPAPPRKTSPAPSHLTVEEREAGTGDALWARLDAVLGPHGGRIVPLSSTTLTTGDMLANDFTRLLLGGGESKIEVSPEDLVGHVLPPSLFDPFILDPLPRKVKPTTPEKP